MPHVFEVIRSVHNQNGETPGSLCSDLDRALVARIEASEIFSWDSKTIREAETKDKPLTDVLRILRRNVKVGFEK